MTNLIKKAPIKIININNKINTDELIELLNNNKWEPSTAYDPVKLERYTPKSLKNSITLDIEEQSEIHSVFNQIFESQMIPYVKSYDQNFDSYFQHSIKAIKYGKGDYVRKHDDCGDVKISDDIFHVQYSCLLYLNDSHGGQLIVDGEEINIKAGTFVIFPAETIHEVKPILSGHRYTVLFRLFKKIRKA